MTLKEFWRREKYVAVHAQTWKFRTVKYLVLVIIGWAVYAWKGWAFLGMVFAVLLILSIIGHFFFRYKTDGWRKSWGPYKHIPIPDKDSV